MGLTLKAATFFFSCADSALGPAALHQYGLRAPLLQASVYLQNGGVQIQGHGQTHRPATGYRRNDNDVVCTDTPHYHRNPTFPVAVTQAVTPEHMLARTWLTRTSIPPAHTNKQQEAGPSCPEVTYLQHRLTSLSPQQLPQHPAKIPPLP